MSPGNQNTRGSASINRRRVLQLGATASVLSGTAGLSSCSKAATSSGSDDTALRMLYLGDTSQQSAFKKLIKEFNKEHPHIKVKPTGIPADGWGDFVNTVSTQIAGGKIPDTVHVAIEGQALFASKKDLLEPLDDYIKKDSDTVDEYYDTVNEKLLKWTKQYGSKDNKRYFMPDGYNTVAMNCSKTLFKKAGLDIPNDDWTWDDFKKAGHKIKKKTGAYMIPAGYGFTFGDIMPWLLTNGASTMDEDWSQATFDSSGAIEAAEFVRSLVVDKLAPVPGGKFDAATQMKKGKLACFGAGRYANAAIAENKLTDDVQIIDFPSNTGKMGSPVGWNAWPIFHQSKNKDDAWTFIKFVMSKKAQTVSTETGGADIPARDDVAKHAAFTKNGPDGSKTLPEALSYATPIPSPPKNAEIDKVVTQAWQKIVTGHGKAEPTLKKANEKIQGYL